MALCAPHHPNRYCQILHRKHQHRCCPKCLTTCYLLHSSAWGTPQPFWKQSSENYRLVPVMYRVDWLHMMWHFSFEPKARSSPRCRENDCCSKKICSNFVQKFSLLTRAIAWDWPLGVCWVSLFALRCSRLQPDLSNSFLNILLVNNTVRGLFVLGYW